MASIDWRSGYSAKWRVMTVNKTTWANKAEFKNIFSVSVDRDCSGDAPLLESGTIKYTSSLPPYFPEGYYRFELVVTQGENRAIFPIATMLCSSRAGNIDKHYSEMDVDCYSVLKPASEVYFSNGEFAPIKVNGPQWCAQKLREGGVAAPVHIYASSSFTLNQYYVFDDSVSYLAGIWKVLNGAGWTLIIDGNGEITIQPIPSSVYARFNRNYRGLFLTEMDYNGSIEGVPNKYIATDASGKTAIATNLDRNSITSYYSRGRYIEYRDSSPIQVNGESLAEYAKRRLKEMSSIVEQYSYKREFYPNLVPRRLIEFDFPEENLVGTYRITRQSLSFGAGVTVSETVGKEVKTYAG